MNTAIIKDALESSLELLNDEVESITLDDLREEYLIVIKKLEESLNLLEGNE